MLKKNFISYLVVFGLLTAQLVLAQHDAVHMSAHIQNVEISTAIHHDHNHNHNHDDLDDSSDEPQKNKNELCQICIFAKSFNLAALSNGLSEHTVFAESTSVLFLQDVLVHKIPRVSHPARAPPVFLS